MARTKVQIFDEDGGPTTYSEGFVLAFGECIQPDDSLWAYLRVREPKKTGTGKDFRDVTWSFASKEDSPRTWYQPKATFWEEHATDEGTTLSRLFAPPEGTNSMTGKPFDSANTRIIFQLDDVYGELDDRDPAKVWWKIDAKSANVWVHKPLNRDMSDGQKALWKERYGDSDEVWIDLYTLERKDPAKIKETMDQKEQVGVGASAGSGGSSSSSSSSSGGEDDDPMSW